jgi:hypothetical protein
MRKCNDEIYQLGKDQALVKKLKNNKWFRPFFLLGGFNSGAYSFYPNGLAEWDTLKTVLRMATTGWKVLMFVCGFRVYVGESATNGFPLFSLTIPL